MLTKPWVEIDIYLKENTFHSSKKNGAKALLLLEYNRKLKGHTLSAPGGGVGGWGVVLGTPAWLRLVTGQGHQRPKAVAWPGTPNRAQHRSFTED